MTGEVKPRSIEQLSVPEEPVMHVETAGRTDKTSDIHIWLGINISIVVMLMIFGVLLFLPLRLLLHTTYYSRSESIGNNDTTEAMCNTTIFEAEVIPIDHRKLRRCPRLEYKERLSSVFRCDYDRNCTYTRYKKNKDSKGNDGVETDGTIGNKSKESKVSKETDDKNLTECTEESGKDRRMKSVTVAGHILVTMLLISAIAALVEVLRIRFARDKVQNRRRLPADPHSRRSRLSKPLLARSVALRIVGYHDDSRQKPRKKSELLLMLSTIAHA